MAWSAIKRNSWCVNPITDYIWSKNSIHIFKGMVQLCPKRQKWKECRQKCSLNACGKKKLVQTHAIDQVIKYAIRNRNWSVSCEIRVIWLDKNWLRVGTGSSKEFIFLFEWVYFHPQIKNLKNLKEKFLFNLLNILQTRSKSVDSG